MYYFINWRETEEGKVADIPEDIDYLMLAEPSSLSDYALFECILTDEIEESKAVEHIPDYLDDLLQSAKDYPPALALTRKEVRHESKSNEVISKSKFAEHLISRLEFHLQNQLISPYFMARKINKHARWHSKGGFYWIIGYKPQNAAESISYISRDYYICHTSIDEFDIDIAEIEIRFKT